MLVPFGGQTVSLGKDALKMGRVSIDVDTGDSSHAENALSIRTNADMKPLVTTTTQNTLLRTVLLVEI